MTATAYQPAGQGVVEHDGSDLRVHLSLRRVGDSESVHVALSDECKRAFDKPLQEPRNVGVYEVDAISVIEPFSDGDIPF